MLNKKEQVSIKIKQLEALGKKIASFSDEELKIPAVLDGSQVREMHLELPKHYMDKMLTGSLTELELEIDDQISNSQAYINDLTN